MFILPKAYFPRFSFSQNVYFPKGSFVQNINSQRLYLNPTHFAQMFNCQQCLFAKKFHLPTFSVFICKFLFKKKIASKLFLDMDQKVSLGLFKKKAKSTSNLAASLYLSTFLIIFRAITLSLNNRQIKRLFMKIKKGRGLD